MSPHGAGGFSHVFPKILVDRLVRLCCLKADHTVRLQFTQGATRLLV
jgi:hypothetical protein